MRSTMKSLVHVATLAALLGGCSSSSIIPQQEDPIITELKGKNTDFVTNKLGLPNQREETRSGGVIWVYLDKRKGMSASECSVTLSIRQNNVESVVIKTEQPSLLSAVNSSCENIRKSLTNHS